LVDLYQSENPRRGQGIDPPTPIETELGIVADDEPSREDAVKHLVKVLKD
jgi:hypothetical protein